MYSKILCLAALVAVALASDGHGQAYSSQHINRHDGKPEIVHVGHGHEQGHQHGHQHGHDGHGDKHGHGHEIDYYAYPKYDFAYKVEDPHTGDFKSQHESRDGDVVKGYYALKQPDGSEREVHYESDDHTGFHANVKFGTHHVVPHHH